MPLAEPLSVIFPQVESLLRLLAVRLSPNPPPWWHNMDQFCSFHRAMRHSTDECVPLQDAVQGMIDRKIFSIAAEEAAPTPAPAHALAPALAQLSVADPPPPEPVGFEDVETSGVFSLTPVFSEFISALVDSFNPIDAISSSHLS